MGFISKKIISSYLLFLRLAWTLAQNNGDLQPCGQAFYSAENYTCYDFNFLCPIINGEPTLKCGPDCYLPEMYSCENNHLLYPPASTSTPVPTKNAPLICSATPLSLQLSSPPYDNFFYSDCQTSSQVVVTSPQADSNLTLIGPRLLVAWPAGNSGVVTFFAPESGINGSLAIMLINDTAASPITSVSESSTDTVGITGLISFNSSAVLAVTILGSIRTIRDFTEGPSLLRPEIQSAIKYESFQDGGVKMSRLWLDNVTTTTMTFSPTDSGQTIQVDNETVMFPAGSYNFTATFNYPQLTQLTSSNLLNNASQGLISQQPDLFKSLEFLSYSTKLLAGAWRFLTYFGRDSMISALLMEPILNPGEGGAIEAVIAGVLERVNRTDGSVCHEETIGDYATYLNMQENITSTAPQCDYKMIDSDYYLPPLMNQYFVNNAVGSNRISSFFQTTASVLPENSNLSYADLALINANKIMTTSAPFAARGNQTTSNLIHLKEGQIVGEWRDSTFGIGGGRIPYDVNTALVPAALRAIASLSRAGFFPLEPDWGTLADIYAQIWEDSTLEFFQVTIPATEAVTRLEDYVSRASFNGSSQKSAIDADVIFHALALEGNDNLTQVQVMNTDDCFRLFMLKPTNQTQLTAFLNQTANNLHRTFPAGLMTDVGVVIANPAYGEQAVYAENFTTSAYHGTVVWSWQLAMLARGLEIQLSRCSDVPVPDFCADEVVLANVRGAYNALWDVIEANSEHLSTEVWSWVYEGGKFDYIDLGALPPPAGQNPTESDIVQLWSLTFLAVTRNVAFSGDS